MLVLAYFIHNARANTPRAFSDTHLRARWSGNIISLTLFVFLACTRRDREVAHRWQFAFSTGVRSLRSLVSKGGLFSSFGSSGSFCLGSRLGQKLLEVFKKIWCSIEEECDLRVDVLNRFGFALIRLQDFQELLVDFWPLLKAILLIPRQSITITKRVIHHTLILFT